jgi:hypothetical protein
LKGNNPAVPVLAMDSAAVVVAAARVLANVAVQPLAVSLLEVNAVPMAVVPLELPAVVRDAATVPLPIAPMVSVWPEEVVTKSLQINSLLVSPS